MVINLRPLVLQKKNRKKIFLANVYLVILIILDTYISEFARDLPEKWVPAILETILGRILVSSGLGQDPGRDKVMDRDEKNRRKNFFS